jgi:hypothetical protein
VVEDDMPAPTDEGAWVKMDGWTTNPKVAPEKRQRKAAKMETIGVDFMTTRLKLTAEGENVGTELGSFWRDM